MPHPRVFFSLCLALAVFAAPSLARADEAQEHTGFYIRGELGAGWLHASATVPGASLGVGGFAGGFSITAGAAVVPNLVIAGDLYSFSAAAPKITVNGESATTRSDVRLGLAGIGPNVTYYLMPANVYLSATPSIARLSLDDGSGGGGSTPFGFGARLAVGKEWWVGKRFGLGVSGNLFVAWNADDITVGTKKTDFYWTTLGGGIALSGSYD